MFPGKFLKTHSLIISPVKKDGPIEHNLIGSFPNYLLPNYWTIEKQIKIDYDLKPLS